jgi:NAD(P)-dependent dehydrogenase (short-subunit alcohol dehydrogenase family)
MNLPPDPFEKNLCWHDESMFENGGDAVSAGAVLLTPEWVARDAKQSITVPADSGDRRHTVILCDWPEEKSKAVAAAVGETGEVVQLSESPSLSMDRRFIACAGAVFDSIKRSIQLLQKTRNSSLVQLVVPGTIDGDCLQGMAGMLRTARKEHSRFIGQVIVLDPALPAETIVMRLRDNLLQPADTLVRYESNERRVQVWNSIPEDGRPFVWKDGGVFLITGGAGALGLITAKHIARRSRRPTIVLIGRSPVSEAIRKAADEIHGLGARVIYEQLDIADTDEVYAAVQRIVSECGALTGIIHCAGIVRDRSILSKTASELEDVLRPKVTGLRNLDGAAKSIPLEFFLLFSSVSAIFGNPGQCDYAAANAFLNDFSVYRNGLVRKGQRSGHTVSINWPLWAGGGMDTDAESKAFLKTKYSIVPLPADAAVTAMEHALKSGRSEVCVLYGDPARLSEAVRGGRL